MLARREGKWWLGLVAANVCPGRQRVRGNATGPRWSAGERPGGVGWDYNACHAEACTAGRGEPWSGEVFSGLRTLDLHSVLNHSFALSVAMRCWRPITCRRSRI